MLGAWFDVLSGRLIDSLECVIDNQSARMSPKSMRSQRKGICSLNADLSTERASRMEAVSLLPQCACRTQPPRLGNQFRQASDAHRRDLYTMMGLKKCGPCASNWTGVKHRDPEWPYYEQT